MSRVARFGVRLARSKSEATRSPFTQPHSTSPLDLEGVKSSNCLPQKAVRKRVTAEQARQI